jgi:hypothetical protein
MAGRRDIDAGQTVSVEIHIDVNADLKGIGDGRAIGP